MFTSGQVLRLVLMYLCVLVLSEQFCAWSKSAVTWLLAGERSSFTALWPLLSNNLAATGGVYSALTVAPRSDCVWVHPGSGHCPFGMSPCHKPTHFIDSAKNPLSPWLLLPPLSSQQLCNWLRLSPDWLDRRGDSSEYLWPFCTYRRCCVAIQR